MQKGGRGDFPGIVNEGHKFHPPNPPQPPFRKEGEAVALFRLLRNGRNRSQRFRGELRIDTWGLDMLNPVAV